MRIDLFSNGGTYLKTFKSLYECAAFFGRTPSYIKTSLKVRKDTRLIKNGIRYLIKERKEND